MLVRVLNDTIELTEERMKAAQTHAEYLQLEKEMYKLLTLAYKKKELRGQAPGIVAREKRRKEKKLQEIATSSPEVPDNLRKFDKL